MNLNSLRRAALVPSALALLLAASACTSSASAPDGSAPSEAGSVAHGIDAGGAAEVSSPALALAIGDRGGELALLDLETEERTVLTPSREGVEFFGDGRLIYRAGEHAGATAVEVIDTARWTVPHGDHTHSFLGEPRLLGTLGGEGAVRVTAGEQRAAVAFSSGDTVLLAHDLLADGLDAAPVATVDSSGPVTLFADHLLVATEAGIEVRDLGGTLASPEVTPCPAASDVDSTRVGMVFACADGSVLFTRKAGGAIAVERIPVPAGAVPPRDLAGRADRPDLAGVAAGEGAWLLDVRQREWTLLPTDASLLSAAALGDDDSRTVAVDIDGHVLVLAPDGAVLARTEPLLAASVADPALRDRVRLLIDARHAYVTDPADGSVHEIDHADGRVTRTFADLDPWFVHQVG